jgi:hypothetical protein
MRYMLTRRGYKGSKSNFQVLLMFSSIDWQLHLMFHVEHWNAGCDQIIVTIGGGELPHEEYCALLRELGSAPVPALRRTILVSSVPGKGCTGTMEGQGVSPSRLTA